MTPTAGYPPSSLNNESIAPTQANQPVGVSSAVAGSYKSLEGVALHIYGNSFGVSPGLACTAGLEYFKRLQSRWTSAAPVTYAVSGSGLYEVCYDLNGTWTSGTGASVVGSFWGTARKGIPCVNALTNMYTNPDAAGNVQPVTPDGLLWLKYLARSIFATLSAGQKIESSAATASGTWTTFANTHYSAGSTRYTSTQGAYLEFTGVVVPAGVRSMWVMVNITDDASTFEVSVDGVVQASFSQPATKPTVRSFRHGSFATPVVAPPGGGALYSFPVFTRVTADPGTHTVRVTKTDPGSGTVVVDGLIVGSASRAQIVTFLDPLPATSGSRAEIVGRDQFIANKLQIDPVYQAVCAEFPNVSLVDLSDLFQQGGISATDGLHPNDFGMLLIANRVEDALAKVSPRPGMYTTV